MNGGKPNCGIAWKSWAARLMGLVYLGVGCLFGILTLIQIGNWVSGGYDYYQPHACACLECLHEVEETPDGHVYCAEFPPKDIKMSGISGVRYLVNQFTGGTSGLAGTVFAGLCVFFGGLWLFGLSKKTSLPAWLKGMQVAAPFIAVAAPVFIRLFLWPLGFFSIG